MVTSQRYITWPTSPPLTTLILIILHSISHTHTHTANQASSPQNTTRQSFQSPIPSLQHFKMFSSKFLTLLLALTPAVTFAAPIAGPQPRYVCLQIMPQSPIANPHSVIPGLRLSLTVASTRELPISTNLQRWKLLRLLCQLPLCQ